MVQTYPLYVRKSCMHGEKYALYVQSLLIAFLVTLMLNRVLKLKNKLFRNKEHYITFISRSFYLNGHTAEWHHLNSLTPRLTLHWKHSLLINIISSSLLFRFLFLSLFDSDLLSSFALNYLPGIYAGHFRFLITVVCRLITECFHMFVILWLTIDWRRYANNAPL